MPHELKGLYKVGGGAFIVSGVLFLLKALLDLMAGTPPSSGVEILGWAASRRFALAITNEVLFIAGLCLVPAVIALYHSLATTDRAKAATGCGIIAVVIPIIAVLAIVHGRLVYPVYGIGVRTPEVAELVVALYYGGLHAIGILLGSATIVLSLAMKHAPYGKRIAYLGVATGLLDIIGAYPYAIGPILTLGCQVCFAAWFVAVGWQLKRMRGLGAAEKADAADEVRAG